MNKYLPTFLSMSIFDIDYATLYAQGKKVILFDLDNTIASYEEEYPNKNQLMLNQKLLKIGYRIYIVSNNGKKRVSRFVKEFKVNGYITYARKPFKKKLNHFIQKEQLKKEEIILIGDQLLTDIACANRLGVTSILVQSISRKSEKWYTKLNRLREKKILKQLEKIDIGKTQQIKKMIEKSSDIDE